MADAPIPPARATSRSQTGRARQSMRLSDGQLRTAIRQATKQFAKRPEPNKPLVLTGLMGVGKTAVGKRLASLMKVRFIDSDEEIEKAAGLKISEIFDRFGEPYFRDRERAVIERLVTEGPAVIAIGGGAFINDTTRTLILDRGFAIWLQAPLDVLVERTGRRDTRPLLKQGNPREILENLLKQRQGAYAQAPVHANSGLGRLDRTVLSILNRANRQIFGARPKPKTKRRRPRKAKGPAGQPQKVQTT